IDDAFGRHHDRHVQPRLNGPRLLLGHQLPACCTALGQRISASRAVETPSSPARSRRLSKLDRRKIQHRAVICTVSRCPICSARRHITCSLKVSKRFDLLANASTTFFRYLESSGGESNTDKQPWRTLTLKSL